jgi:peptidoglycan/xylan/chitin deacetylase (PgdA/CDA1 family)
MSPGPTPCATVAPTTAPTPTPLASATPRPTPAPTPRPTVRPTPAPTATPGQLQASALVRHGARTSNDVALTFDMGGRVEDALAIVGWLVDHDIHASIFMTGAMADSVNTDAGRKVLAIVQAHPDQLTLGNHSYTHRDFRSLSATEIRDELRRTEAAIAPWCSQDLHPFFRPPNGGYNAAVLAAVGANGYPYTVTWDVDTIDWRPIVNDPPGPTADQMVAKVLGNAQGGSIVLMHLGGYETFEALPRIVDGLRATGFDLVTLDELL